MSARRKAVCGAAAALLLLLVPAAAEAKWPAGYKPQERTWFSYGVRYTEPQIAAVSLTVMRAMESDAGMVTGWFFQAEPGLDGGKISVGVGGLSPSDRAYVPPIFGAGVKASVMRTWGAAPHETLIGPEVDLTLPYVKFSCGWLWATDGAGRFTWGVGVGF